jgi:hypothetical protein
MRIIRRRDGSDQTRRIRVTARTSKRSPLWRGFSFAILASRNVRRSPYVLGPSSGVPTCSRTSRYPFDERSTRCTDQCQRRLGRPQSKASGRRFLHDFPARLGAIHQVAGKVMSSLASPRQKIRKRSGAVVPLGARRQRTTSTEPASTSWRSSSVRSS